MFDRIVAAVNQVVAPLTKRVANMVARGVVKVVDDQKKMQIVQVDLLGGETRDDVERPQAYGFTSVPDEGAEVVILCPGGRRDQALAIAVEDRRYRIGNLNRGEVAVYDKTGSKIVLKSNGDIEITPSSGVVKLTGDLKVSGDVVGHAGSVNPLAPEISLTGHTHTVAGANGGGAVVFTPVAGKTGGPS